MTGNEGQSSTTTLTSPNRRSRQACVVQLTLHTLDNSLGTNSNAVRLSVLSHLSRKLTNRFNNFLGSVLNFNNNLPCLRG